MARAKKPIEVPPLSKEEAQRLAKIGEDAAARFDGPFDELESAIGMLTLGRLFGWRVLILIHNKRTIRKYEEILGINVREFFDETGPLTQRSFGYRVVERLGNFWKAVSGDVKVEGRREVNS